MFSTVKQFLFTNILKQNRMSNKKCFENPFPDYSVENAKFMIYNKEIHPQSQIIECIPKKLHDTFQRCQVLDYHDNSVYTGSTGIALLKWKQNPDCKQNLEEAVQLLGLHKLKNKRATFLCGDAGPLAIAAILYHKLNKPTESDEAICRLTALKDDVLDANSDLPNEYLYGRTGYLYAILFVNKHIIPKPFDDDFIRKIVQVIIAIGRRGSKTGKFDCPLMYQWHGSYYLGAAHGLTGILYLLLQTTNHVTDEELSEYIKPTIDYLITLQFPSGNFPSSLGREHDKYVQWCHGAPGFLYLFTTAYKVFKKPKYLKLAEQCGDVIWKRGLLRKGYSICHGVAGNAYCFLELFQTTRNDKHLYRALKFVEWCVDYKKEHEEHSPDRPLSLYEGIAGPMYLLLDILNPLEAKFPGFSL